MCRSTMSALRGMLAGLFVGLTAGACGACYWHRNRRGVKRRMGRALHNMGELVDNVTGMF